MSSQAEDGGDDKGATPPDEILVQLDAVVSEDELEEDLLQILVDLDAVVSRIGHHDVPVRS